MPRRRRRRGMGTCTFNKPPRRCLYWDDSCGFKADAGSKILESEFTKDAALRQFCSGAARRLRFVQTGLVPRRQAAFERAMARGSLPFGPADDEYLDVYLSQEKKKKKEDCRYERIRLAGGWVQSDPITHPKLVCPFTRGILR